MYSSYLLLIKQFNVKVMRLDGFISEFLPNSKICFIPKKKKESIYFKFRWLISHKNKMWNKMFQNFISCEFSKMWCYRKISTRVLKEKITAHWLSDWFHSFVKVRVQLLKCWNINRCFVCFVRQCLTLNMTFDSVISKNRNQTA